MENEYKKTFIKPADTPDKSKDTKRIKKENRFILSFFIQSCVCILIIGCIVSIKYIAPTTFVSVSSTLNGLYEQNITLSDLSDTINEKLMNNDAVAAFFNMGK